MDSKERYAAIPDEAIRIAGRVDHPHTGLQLGTDCGKAVLAALQEAGYPIRWVCSGCCNCWPSNFTDPLCDGNGHPIKDAA